MLRTECVRSRLARKRATRVHSHARAWVHRSLNHLFQRGKQHSREAPAMQRADAWCKNRAWKHLRTRIVRRASCLLVRHSAKASQRTRLRPMRAAPLRIHRLSRARQSMHMHSLVRSDTRAVEHGKRLHFHDTARNHQRRNEIMRVHLRCAKAMRYNVCWIHLRSDDGCHA